MTFETLPALLLETDDPTSRELVDAINVGYVAPVAPGRETAGGLTRTFAIRARTTASAGASTHGIERTLAVLDRLPSDTPILLFHYSGSERVFTVFATETDQRIIGVVSVDRRLGDAESP